MTLTEYQESILQKRAEDGHARDWALYLGTRRDEARLAALDEALDPHDVAARRACDVLRLDADPDRFDAVWARMDDEEDPWIFYTVAKFLLGRDRVKDALAVAFKRLSRDKHDVSVLNLVARHCLATEDFDLAGELVKRSLRLCPRQDDIEALGTRAAGKAPLPYALYLDTAPRLEEVAFYLPVYNVERYIRMALDGICGQNYPLAEVLVVDDGSPDNSVAIAREYPVRIEVHEENRGLAAARNTAFRAADTVFVGAIDTDAWPAADYTRNILMEFENGDPDLAGAGGRLIEAHQKHPADRWRAKYLAQQQGPARICTPEGLFGSNTLFKREAVLAVGGYNPRHRTNGEDVYLCKALRAGGYDFVYTPHAVAWHERTDTVESVLRMQWNWVFPGKDEAGVYKDPFYLLVGIEKLLEAVDGYFENDLRLGELHSLYIDALCLFHLGFRDIAATAREGAVTAAEARFLQDGMLDALYAWDKTREGLVYLRIAMDTVPLLVEPQPGDSVRPEFQAWMGTFAQELARVFDRIPPDVYPHLTPDPFA